MPKHASSATLLVGVVLFVVGCDGGDGADAESNAQPAQPEQEISAVVERYKATLAARDAPAVCGEILAPSTIAEFFSSRTKCEQRITQWLKPGGPFSEVPASEIVGIERQGNSATVRLSSGGYFHVVRESGTWYVQLIS